MDEELIAALATFIECDGSITTELKPAFPGCPESLPPHKIVSLRLSILGETYARSCIGHSPLDGAHRLAEILVGAHRQVAALQAEKSDHLDIAALTPSGTAGEATEQLRSAFVQFCQRFGPARKFRVFSTSPQSYLRACKAAKGLEGSQFRATVFLNPQFNVPAGDYRIFREE